VPSLLSSVDGSDRPGPSELRRALSHRALRRARGRAGDSMSCRQSHCGECGDRLIHQSSRGAHESSSELGQHVHDNLTPLLSWMDIDGVAWEMHEDVLRILEHKRPGQRISTAQSRILPKLATMLEQAVLEGQLGQGSGAFVLWWDLESEIGYVSRVLDEKWAEESSAKPINRRLIDVLLSARRSAA